MVFDRKYADAYDLLYQDKDYEKECDFIEELFRKYNCQPRTILDLGCGTGNHALILAKRGYKVTGIDRAVNMLGIARGKAEAADTCVEFIEGDVTNVILDKKFDAVVSMFAVMSYQVTNAAIAAVCKQAKDALVPGGMFVFDCWHGPGVFADKPTTRLKEVDSINGKMIRFSEPEIDFINHIVKVNFTFWKIENDKISKTSELHLMRFFFPQEIKYYLEVAGFEKVELYPFLDLNRSLAERDWTMTVVGR